MKFIVLAFSFLLLGACASKHQSTSPNNVVYPVSSCTDLDDRSKALNEETIRRCMDRQNGYIQKIYLHYLLKKDPKLSGAIVANITIQADGSFTGIVMQDKSAVPPDFSGQVIAYLQKVTFPRSSSVWEGNYTWNFFPD